MSEQASGEVNWRGDDRVRWIAGILKVDLGKSERQICHTLVPRLFSGEKVIRDWTAEFLELLMSAAQNPDHTGSDKSLNKEAWTSLRDTLKRYREFHTCAGQLFTSTKP